jgi:hypothetical protein
VPLAHIPSMPNLPDVTSKFHVTKSVKVKKFHIKRIGMFMSYLHTKFHMSNSNGPLVRKAKLEAKYRFWAVDMFYTLQKYGLKESCIFS